MCKNQKFHITAVIDKVMVCALGTLNLFHIPRTMTIGWQKLLWLGIHMTFLEKV